MQKPENISAIIVDDDAFCREHLSDLIAKSAKNVELVKVCENGKEAIKAINKLNPQLVFLDVEMPGMNGFDMLKEIGKLNFEVVFTTSFDHYAIRAIRFAALDYLLKPVRADMLQEAVSRAVEKINKEQKVESDLLPDNTRKEVDLVNLGIPTLEGLNFVKTEDVIRCEADDRYTKVFLADKRMILASRTLGEFEDLLEPAGFIRVHNSHLINLKHLKKYIKGEGGQVMMSDGTYVDVSRRKKDELLHAVSQFK